ncbi:MAG: PAS domain S-box protein, partial [Deltaproteobacteria bacterium]|nr:PAS domain S-box protein [Deltaproteobacteria bacterium]
MKLSVKLLGTLFAGTAVIALVTGLLAYRFATPAGIPNITFPLVSLVTLALLATSGLATWLIFRWILRPIGGLTKTVQAIRQGNLSQRAVAGTKDEIGDLAWAFNRMMENLSSEKRYRAITESTADAIISIDSRGRIIFWNKGAEQLFGYAQGDILGKTLPMIMPERFRDAHRKGLARYLATRKAHVIGKTVELTGLKKTGEEFPVDLTLSVWEQEAQPYFTAVIRDLSDRKAAEKEREDLKARLAQAQKMESIGRLTGGVAHDFNNLLGIITGNCELALLDLKPDDPVREYLRDVKEAGDRAAVLTGQLLAFSRRQVLQPRVLNLNEVLEGMDRMLRRIIGEDIQVCTIPAGDLGCVKADPHQLEQVIFNLVSNARDAMPDGGKVTLETRNVTLDAHYAEQHHEVRPGPYVLLACSDTGVGMDAQTLAQIFEPFFTTKERGKGTGLGLS